MFQQVLTRAGEYDVLALPNLDGDYMNDALVAQVGGLGLGPGANVADIIACFEATHGTVLRCMPNGTGRCTEGVRARLCAGRERNEA